MIISRDNQPYFCIKTYFVTHHYNRLLDGSNEGSQHMFLLRNKNLNYPQYTILSGALRYSEIIKLP